MSFREPSHNPLQARDFVRSVQAGGHFSHPIRTPSRGRVWPRSQAKYSLFVAMASSTAVLSRASRCRLSCITRPRFTRRLALSFFGNLFDSTLRERTEPCLTRYRLGMARSGPPSPTSSAGLCLGIVACLVPCLAPAALGSGNGAAPPEPGIWEQVDAGTDMPLRLVVAASASLRETPDWRQKLAAAVDHAEQVLLTAFGRRLEIHSVTTWPGGEAVAELDVMLLQLLRTVQREQADVLVGITLGSRARRPRHRTRSGEGVASYEDGAIVLRILDSPGDAGLLLAHEIAHLLGALHRPGHGLLDPEARDGGIDELNRAVIGLHRDRLFRQGAFPLPERHQVEALSLYERLLDASRQTERVAAALHVSRLLIELRRYEQAIAQVQAVIAEHPERSDAWEVLGIAWRRSGRYADALAAYDRALGIRPDDFHLHYNRGIALRNHGDPDGALEAYERAISIAPGFSPALANLGLLYAERGRHAEAIAALETALELQPEYAVAEENLAFARLIAGDYEAARELSLALLERRPASASAHNTLGQILEVDGDREGATSHYRRAIELDPSYPSAYLSLAQAYVDAGESAGAEAAARDAVRMRPSWPRARVVLARALAASGRWQQAAAELRRAVELKPGGAAVHAELGHALLMAGDHRAAEQATRQALRLDPGPAWAWVNLGVIMAGQGDLAAAVEAYERATVVEPGYADAHINLGHARLQLGNAPGASQAYEAALALGVESGPVLNNLTAIHYRSGDIDRAWAYALRAHEAGAELHPQLVAALEQATGKRFPQR